MATSYAHQFHLFCERLRPAEHASTPHLQAVSDAGAPGKLELPHEPVRLELFDGDNPRVASLDTASVRGSLILEPILTRSHQVRLLVVSADDAALTVNGELAPRVALLKERDQFQLAHAVNFHIAVFQQPRIGPPPPEVLGRPCALCLVPFIPETRCYVCLCGCALHIEGGPHEEFKLQCARVLRECLCHRPLILTPSYSSLPNLEL